MKKTIALFVLMQTLVLHVYALTVDPVGGTPGLQGEDRVNELLERASQAPKEDSSVPMGYIREARAISESLQRTDLSAKTWAEQGDMLFNAGEYHPAIRSYQKAIGLYTQIGSLQLLGELYNGIGLSYYYLGEYEKAIETQIEAVKNFEKSGSTVDLARIYINMGMVYNRLADYESARNYYRKAARISFKLNDPNRIGNSYNGLGTAFYSENKLDSAKFFYRKALYYFRSAGNDERSAAAINNLANIYVSQKDSVAKALAYYLQAWKLYDKTGNLRNKVFVMEGLGGAYAVLGQHQKALETLWEGLKLARDNQFGYYIIHLYYRDLSAVYEQTGRIEEALSAYKNYKVYLDSLRQEERLFQAAAIEKKYEFSRNEAIIDRLNSEKEIALVQIEKDKAFRNLGIFAILILMVIVTYVSFANFQRKRVNRELTQKNLQIEAQRKELEQMNASKNKFFSIIAHDLKNPLHTVLGYSFLLHHDYERFGDKDRKRYARDIYNSTNNIFRLLQNLLDWSRSQTGRINYEPVPFDLVPLIGKICALFVPVADDKQIEITCNGPEGGILVNAMPMMVETVLRNLVGNALKFTPDGGKISVSFRVQDRHIAVLVADTGIGLNETELNQLFAIDSKIRRKGTRNEEGSGLGLILCKEFVLLNKGTIWAESTPGQGSTFGFTIPLAF